MGALGDRARCAQVQHLTEPFGDLLIHRGDRPLRLGWTGKLRCRHRVRVRWELDGRLLWQGEVGSQDVALRLPELVLEPGQKVLEVHVEGPPESWLHLIDQLVEVLPLDEGRPAAAPGPRSAGGP